MFENMDASTLSMLALCVGLVLLAVSASLYSKVNKLAAAQGSTPAPSPAQPAIQAQPQAQNDGELVAVITAAVAMMLEAEQAQAPDAPEALPAEGFVVRSIRRVSNTPAWNRAGREEQIYSRF